MPEETERDCLFCRIQAGDIPSDPVAQDDLTYAFRDINPVAPVHVLVVPRQHVGHLGAVEPDHAPLVAAMVRTTQVVAAQEGVADDGYRVVINVGRHGGMTVDHLHFHVIGGRPLRWPPE
ncbi:MAG: histidine triad nucleotide-binding protein [Actinobacteria bacterium]|nr:histidine triad nucleotide-binding protein [Actinomycetota bacterium]